jgi:hypothetical protein
MMRKEGLLLTESVRIRKHRRASIVGRVLSLNKMSSTESRNSTITRARMPVPRLDFQLSCNVGSVYRIIFGPYSDHIMDREGLGCEQTKREDSARNIVLKPLGS